MVSFPMITQVLGLSKTTCSNPRKNLWSWSCEIWKSKQECIHRMFFLASIMKLFSGMYSDIFSLLFLSVVCMLFAKHIPEFWRTKSFWRTESKVKSFHHHHHHNHRHVVVACDCRPCPSNLSKEVGKQSSELRMTFT